MDESADNEGLQKLKAKIEAQGNPEFDTSSIVQVKDHLKQLSLIVKEPRIVQNIEAESGEFDHWL